MSYEHNYIIQYNILTKSVMSGKQIDFLTNQNILEILLKEFYNSYICKYKNMRVFYRFI